MLCLTVTAAGSFAFAAASEGKAAGNAEALPPAVSAETVKPKAEPAGTAAARTQSTDKSAAADSEAGSNTPVEEPERVTVMLTGDLMCQPKQQEAAFDGSSYDFKPTFKYVKAIFDEADIVIGNLETLVSSTLPLSKDMNRLQNKPYLNAPEEFLDALEYAGFDAFIMANNHDCDGGEIGIVETLNELDSRSIPHTGLFRSKDDKRYFIIEQNGIKLGVLSYAAYFNLKDKFLSGEKQKFMLNRPIQSQMDADVRALKKEGADYIIAYNHCGTEYSQVPAARQERYGIMLAKAGVDYIVGSHPHVLQPYEPLMFGEGEIPYIYSMGNFSSAMLSPITKETIVLSLTLERNENGEVELAEQSYYPCYMLDEYGDEPFVLIPESEEYAPDFYENAAAKLIKQLEKNFKHIRKTVGALK